MSGLYMQPQFGLAELYDETKWQEFDELQEFLRAVMRARLRLAQLATSAAAEIELPCN